MTELNDDATVITLNRSRELAESQAKPRLAPRERADFNALGASLSADVAIPDAAPSPGTPAAVEVQVPADSAPVPAPDDGAAFRQTRLAVTAGLVVLLLVVWIAQRRNMR